MVKRASFQLANQQAALMKNTPITATGGRGLYEYSAAGEHKQSWSAEVSSSYLSPKTSKMLLRGASQAAELRRN
ncbi:hypothetical protein MHYP_G00091350 [Metynnis hypsauchen]